MWNGTAEILKQKPTNMNTRPKIRPILAPCCVALAMPAKLMVPVKP